MKSGDMTKEFIEGGPLKMEGDPALTLTITEDQPQYFAAGGFASTAISR